MLFTNHFEYNGINSIKYGLQFMQLNTEKLKQICAETKYNTSFYKSLDKRNIDGVTIDDSPLSFDVEIISEAPIQYHKAREIKKWLFNSLTYGKLYSANSHDITRENIDGQIKRLYVECVFYNPEEIRFSGNLFGWKCTCELASNMAFQDPIEQAFTDCSQPIVLNIDTDKKDYTYPYVVISVGNGTAVDINIKNLSDNGRSMRLKNIPGQTDIYADCAIGLIIDNTDKSVRDNLVDGTFLRLLPGENILQTTGINSLKIQWQNLRWIL